MKNHQTAMAYAVLMTQTDNDHYDSGYDGICSDCRTCQFHRPLWTKQSCVFSVCPYSSNHLSTKKKDLKKEHRIAGRTGVMHM